MLPRKCLWIFVYLNLHLVSYISCEDGISLAFAIDDTRSMGSVISQVKHDAKAILNMVLNTKSSKVKDFVLVTINDPDVILRTRTSSASDFLKYINRIRINNYGNEDCPERAIAGIEKALMFTKRESYIYVFTDASTKDLDKLNNVKRLCQKKQSQVVFVLTGDCYRPTHRRFMVYYEIAKACSGQVFRVKKEQVHSVLKTIEIMLKGKNSIFKWTTVPRSSTFVPVEFTLDEKAEYAIISTSGRNVQLKVTTMNNQWGPTPKMEKTMWNDNGRVISLIEPKPGTYYAWVRGESTVSVVIYGRTDFTFGYGFSVLEATSMRDTAQQPIAGLKQHLLINVTDPDHSVDIKFAEILDIKNNDHIIETLSLRNIGENIYITEGFLFSNDTIKIAVKGEIKKKTNATITRNSRHIIPQIVDLIPESKPFTKIEEGTRLNVKYGSQVSLTCKIIAHPTPKIEWYSSSEGLLPSNSSVLEDPLFVSNLKLQNIKQSETYLCKASNKLGPGRDSKIHVNVMPVFTKTPLSEEAEHNAKYGEDTKIFCNIKSDLPITIKWFRYGKELSDHSDKHVISSDGLELTLKSTDIKMQGKYTCEATLSSDPTVKQTHDIEVKIPGLALPKIQSTRSDINIMKEDKIELNCKILRGYPKPQVKWFKKVSNVYTPLASVSSEVLTINEAFFMNAGQYKCEVINPIGTDTATFEVTVSSLPDITISGAKEEVPYDSNAEITCKVESYPAASIIWTDESGAILQDKVTQISGNEFVSQLKLQNIRRSATYNCFASNTVGSTNEYINITVPPPFEVKTHINESIGINYGSEKTLQCDIKSTVPMEIQWYRQQIGVKSSRSVVRSSDKYSISGDGTELTIKSMNMDTAGTYTCEASLLSVPTEKVAFTTTVNVGLNLPEIQSTNRNIRVMKGDKIEINCTNVRVYPKAHVIWYKKYSDGYKIQDGSSEVLTVDKAAFIHSGQYKCESTNTMGTDTATFEVTVSNSPDITISATKREVPYDSDTALTCKVESYPAPIIEWKDASGTVLENKVTRISVNEFASTIKLQNIRNSAVYNCLAINKFGSITDYIKITVMSPFKVQAHINESIEIKYGSKKSLQCEIKSAVPMEIRWYRQQIGVKSSRSVVRSSDKYSISGDGTELTIKSMEMDTAGTYTCEASLLSVPSKKVAFTTTVNVGFTRPEIQFTNNKINTMKGSKIQLNCKILRAYPKPEVKWFKKFNDNYKILDTEHNEVLTVNKATFINAGQYKCEATNLIGTDTAKFEVTVSNLPDITISETKREVPYDSDAEITCKVESYPAPNIVWKDENKLILHNKVTQISENEFASILSLQNIRKSATYICLANNTVGFTNDYVNIKVLSPFEVKTHINEAIGIPYGSKKTLRCDIKSAKSMEIRWYRQKIGVKTSRSVVRSSDKYSISSDGTELTITSMDMDTAGTYTCEASLLSVPTEKVAFSSKVKAVGLIGPEVIYSTTVFNGKNLTVICRIKGVPKPTISWQFKPNGSVEFSSVPGSGEELNIPEVKPSHSGVYRCIAQNVLDKIEREVNVAVTAHPVINKEKLNHYGVEGDLVMKIPCDVTGFPEPTVVWKKGGKVLNSDSKYVIKRTTLYLNKPVRSDSEEFTCEAKNTIGTATEKFVIEIVDEFENDENYYGNIHDIYVEQEKSKTIECSLTNIREGSIRWFMDGMLTKETRSTYTIETASIADEGNYTCRINTDEGSISETYVVYVGYPPFFDEDIPSPQSINWKNAHQMLDCAAESQPPARYEWLHNGKTDTGIHLQQIPITEWGQYTCQVSNVHGNISRTFEVFTSGCYITMNATTPNQPLISDMNTPTWPFSVGNSDILLDKNEQIKLICSNNKKSANTFKLLSDKQEIIAECDEQDKFLVSGETYRYSELECNTEVEPSVINTSEQCAGPDSELLRVGFEVNGFLEAYNVCFNTDKNVPIYASGSIFISRIGDGVESTMFNWSTTAEISNQENRLETEDWKPEGSCKCCYTKGQLVNVNELAFGPAQAATFQYNLNFIPIWNPFCGDSARTSWQNFDDEIRAMSLYNKWSTWTGVSEWERKPPVNGVLAPRYIWKVLNYDEGSTVIVYVNTEEPLDEDIRCSDICETMMESDRFLYCCTLEEFSEKFGVPLDSFVAV